MAQTLVELHRQSSAKINRRKYKDKYRGFARIILKYQLTEAGFKNIFAREAV